MNVAYLDNNCIVSYRNNFKEKNAKEIELPGKEFFDVLELLRVLHPPNADICGELAIQYKKKILT